MKQALILNQTKSLIYMNLDKFFDNDMPHANVDNNLCNWNQYKVPIAPTPIII